ncbi:MAG TPA: aldehyde dehydrogenase family protein, partial [Dongiaceae bacterium]|nr:aldehyde dehydrogenase family protein [Dongiaceae bacterium]
MQIQNFIDGQMVAPLSKQWLDDVEPATGATYASVPDSGDEDVAAAVQAAARAFPAWSRTPAEERCRVLLDLATRLEARLDEFARAESVDTGKPISLARAMDIP